MRRGFEPTAVVADTDLYVSATIIRRGGHFVLVEAWRGGAIRLLTSPEQPDELDRALRRPRMMKYNVTESDIEGLLDRLATTVEVIVLESRPPLSVRDPRDEHILALALAGNADFLVTGDNDLLVLAEDPRLGELRIVTVAAFLALLAGSPDEEDPAT